MALRKRPAAEAPGGSPAPLPHVIGVRMREVLAQKNVKAENVVYVGNDINDLPCFEVAGWSVAVADAFPEVIQAADFVLSKPGGRGAIRELCDLILKKRSSDFSR